MSCPIVLKVLSAADNSMLSSPLVCGCIIRELRGKRSTLGGRLVGALVLGVLLTADRWKVQAHELRVGGNALPIDTGSHWSLGTEIRSYAQPPGSASEPSDIERQRERIVTDRTCPE